MFHISSPPLHAAKLLWPSYQNIVLVDDVHDDAFPSSFSSTKLDADSADFNAGQCLAEPPKVGDRGRKRHLRLPWSITLQSSLDSLSCKKEDLTRLVNRQNACVQQ